MSGGLRRLGPLVVLGLYLSAAPAWAQQPFTVETVVEPDSGLSDTAPFHIVLHITGQQPPGIVQPEPFPLIDGLSVVNGPNTNRRFFWRDGEASATYQLSYVVIAERPGRYTVPSLGVEIDGRDYRTEPLTFEVGRGRDGSRGVSPSGTIGQPRQQADPVFFEIKLGEDEVWVGQPVPLSVTLYSAYRVTGVVFGETPGFPDFWVEQVEVDADAERFQTRIDGRLYTGYPVDRRMLIPLAPGAFTIEPYVGQVQVRQSGAGDRFDFFSFGRTHTVVRKTPELEVHVKPLPPGQPAGFSGAVGRFTIDVRADRDRARVNDAVALRATVEGEGSLQSVAPPTLVEPTGAKLFEPTVTESIERTTGKMMSRKTWEWILVPLDAGEVEIPDLEFAYFDPADATYRVARTEPIRLAVERGEGDGDPTAIRSEIQMQRRDLAYIKPLRGELTQRHAPAHRRTVFRLALVAPVLLTPLVIMLGRRQARLRRDHGLSRARRAGTKARRKLQSIDKRIDQLEVGAFHEELARTLVEYVADRFNRSAAGMTYELAEELLASRSVPDALRRRFRSCLETCDFARFVPSAGKSERRIELLTEAREVVDGLERG